MWYGTFQLFLVYTTYFFMIKIFKILIFVANIDISDAVTLSSFLGHPPYTCIQSFCQRSLSFEKSVVHYFNNLNSILHNLFWTNFVCIWPYGSRRKTDSRCSEKFIEFSVQVSQKKTQHYFMVVVAIFRIYQSLWDKKLCIKI